MDCLCNGRVSWRELMKVVMKHYVTRFSKKGGSRGGRKRSVFVDAEGKRYCSVARRGSSWPTWVTGTDTMTVNLGGRNSNEGGVKKKGTWLRTFDLFPSSLPPPPPLYWLFFCSPRSPVECRKPLRICSEWQYTRWLAVSLEPAVCVGGIGWLG